MYSGEINQIFLEVKHKILSQIKDIFASNDKLYLITRDNKIYVKEGRFDLASSKCTIGGVFILINIGIRL